MAHQSLSTPRRLTLAEVCQIVATDKEWHTHETAKKHLETSESNPLLRDYPDDFSDCAWDAPRVSYSERPYKDHDAAMMFLRAESLRNDLVAKALEWLEQNYWLARARKQEEVSHTDVSYDLLSGLQLSIDSESIKVDGRVYDELRFCAPYANTMKELVKLIGRIAPRMDPDYHIAEDFQAEVLSITGTPFPDTTIVDAMKQADLALGFFKAGRRRGRTKNSNAKK